MADNIPGPQAPKLQFRPLGAPNLNVNLSGSFGEDIGQALQQTGKEVVAYGMREKAKFDDARENDFNTKLGDWEFKRVYNENSPEAAKFRKGENYTPDITDKTLEDYDQFANELMSSAGNDTQAAAFRKVYDRRRRAVEMALSEHESKQHETVAKNQFEGTLSTSIQDGSNNWSKPTARGEAQRSGEEAVTKRGTAEGWSKQQTDDQLRNFRTRFHKAVVEKMKEYDPIAAQRYLDAVGPEVDQEHLGQLRRIVEGDAIMAKSRNIASEIQGRVGASTSKFDAQRADLKGKLDRGEINVKVYEEAENWLKKDNEVKVREEERRNEKNTDIMLNAIRQRAMNKTGVLLSENEDNFKRLDAKGQAKARALVMELMGHDRAANATARSEAREMARKSLQEFKARPLSERAAMGKGTFEEVQARVDQEFLGTADPMTRKIIASEARDAYETKTRGQELHETEFRRYVHSESMKMFPNDPDRQKDVAAKMDAWWVRWRAANEYKVPREQDVDEQIGRAFLVGDSGYWGFGSNKYGYEVEDGDDWTPFDSGDQEWAPNKIVAPKVEKGNSPMSVKTPPMKLPAGYTMVTNGKAFAKVPSAQVEGWLKKNSPAGWRKAE